MNNKGQIGIGIILAVTIAVIVGAVLLQQSASDVSTMTNTVAVTNEQITAPAIGASVTLKGQAVSGFSAVNGTTSTAIPASNYTITNYVVSNGQLISTLTAKGGAIGWQGQLINVTYTYEPYGYDTNSGNRAVITLIIVFFALAIAVVAITPIRDGLKDLM